MNKIELPKGWYYVRLSDLPNYNIPESKQGYIFICESFGVEKGITYYIDNKGYFHDTSHIRALTKQEQEDFVNGKIKSIKPKLSEPTWGIRSQPIYTYGTANQAYNDLQRAINSVNIDTDVRF